MNNYQFRYTIHKYTQISFFQNSPSLSPQKIKQILLLFSYAHLVSYIYIYSCQRICFPFQVNPIKYNSIFSGLATLWKEEGPFLFREVGPESSLDMGFKAGSNLVSTSTSRSFIPMSPWITGVSYSYSAVHLLKYLLMWPFLLSKLLRSVFRRSLISPRVQPTAFQQQYIKMKVLLGMYTT